VSKNVAVFVDVANIFYAAKAAGVDIDYVTLLRSASAGRDLVRAYAYTGLDPDNENQRNFHSFLARNGYRVVSKDIRKYGDGKVKANLDIELVVDMLKTARNLDIAIVVSGDGDFAPAIRAVQEMGVRVEVISFRGNTSSDLIDVADQFTDIVHLAKVEKASSRSGRRVAAEADEDLSMTEVPDKQTEGTGTRGRGRGRERGGASRREPAPAARASRAVGAASRRAAQPTPAAVTSSGAPLVVLPGEKLSRVATGDVPAALVPAVLAPGADEEVAAGGAVAASTGGSDIGDEGAERRRRRRRGGRGRGRGRGRGEAADGQEPRSVVEAAPPGVEAPEEFVEAPRGPRPTPFGSVWDSQLGVPTQAPSSAPLTPLAPIGDDDFDEPEIPEYLIAERNRGRSGGPGGGPGRGPRGGRAGYAAAVDRERYGAASRGGGGGINRYPDVSGRDRPREPGFQRQERGARPPRPAGPRGGGGGGEWSEVPPELEAMLRAQLSTRPKGGPAAASPAPRAAESPVTEAPESGPAEVAAPKRRTPRRASPGAMGAPEAAEGGGETAPKHTATRRTGTSASADAEGAAKAAPKRRATVRKTATKAAPAGDSAAGDSPKPRASRRKSSTETSTT
jgi:uncharacterized LabA/DUF88 family protein